MTHQEKMDALNKCLKEIMELPAHHKLMAIAIKRGTAVSSIISASHREELLESRRQAMQKTISISTEELPKQLDVAASGDTFVSMTKAASLLGVTSTTLRMWERQGKIVSAKTDASNQKVFDIEDIKRLIDEESRSTTSNK